MRYTKGDCVRIKSYNDIIRYKGDPGWNSMMRSGEYGIIQSIHKSTIYKDKVPEERDIYVIDGWSYLDLWIEEIKELPSSCLIQLSRDIVKESIPNFKRSGIYYITSSKIKSSLDELTDSWINVTMEYSEGIPAEYDIIPYHIYIELIKNKKGVGIDIENAPKIEIKNQKVEFQDKYIKIGDVVLNIDELKAISNLFVRNYFDTSVEDSMEKILTFYNLYGDE